MYRWNLVTVPSARSALRLRNVNLQSGARRTPAFFSGPMAGATSGHSRFSSTDHATTISAVIFGWIEQKYL
jgi:hypothetical protein